jgi:hypothetical protein
MNRPPPAQAQKKNTCTWGILIIEHMVFYIWRAKESIFKLPRQSIPMHMVEPLNKISNDSPGVCEDIDDILTNYFYIC